jgi:hypothetical protein
MKNRYVPIRSVLLSVLLVSVPGIYAQDANQAAKKATDTKDDEVIQLSPFEVSDANTNGYAGATTLAGNRLNTEVRDIGNAVTVITGQFMKDIGATDNQTLLQYTTNTEVGNAYGNFAGTGDGAALDESNHFTNPNQNTRIRGLTAADNTRDLFLTDIPWDGYAVDGVDLQRGPNSILFGQGSPAGIINTRTKQASFKDGNEVGFRFDNYGSTRYTLDFNKVLLKNELAVRVAAVRDDTEYREDPAFSLSKRLYGAVRWEPGFLKKGDARTIVKANIEFGDINSNNPRQLPPIDLITPWFATGTYQGTNIAGQPFTYNNLNRLTLIPSQNEDDNTGSPNHGQNRPSHNGPASISGTPNQYYNPWVGNFAQQFGNPSFFFDGNSPTQSATGLNWEPSSTHGIGSDGQPDGGVGGIPFQRPAGVAPYSVFAKNANLEYSQFGIYKDKSLTDPSVFNFFDNLLDGPNKQEWQNFRTYNITLDQTFLHDQIGFELAYNNEWYKNGQLSLLAGENQAIGIDFNSVYSDGTPLGANGQPGGDGTPNPNLGRPYVSYSSQYGNNSYESTRETKRVTVFGQHDFSEDNHGWWGRLLGKQTVTGLFDEYKQDTDTRSWQRYGTDASYEAFVNNNADSPKIVFTDNRLSPNTVIYLGPSLLNATTASGAYIPRPTAVQTITTGNVRVFDSTWNKPTDPTAPGYVNPAAFWYNNYYPTVSPVNPADNAGLPAYTGPNPNGNYGSGNSTQSENPANYVGFVNKPITVMDSEASQANRDYLTHDARLTYTKLESKAFTWQGHFWDNFFVGTFGLRQDTQTSRQGSESVASSSDPYGHLDLSPDAYNLDALKANPASLTVTSRAWTGVAHLNELSFLKKLPIGISLFYNHSTDFQPASQRVDVYGEPLAAPEGVTKDYGILLETLDGRFSLKINKYETTSTGASSSALNGAWFIGNSQAWAANWVNRYEFNWTSDTVGGAVTVNDPTNSEYNYGQAPGETPAQAAAREASVITAWRAWQQSVDPRFYTAWGINLTDHTKSVTATTPNGFSVTEDSTSKGYEFELNAAVTKNWRVSMNASKADATRENIGGTNLIAFVTAYQKALNGGAPGGVGDLRIWWGGAGNETTLQEWNANIGSEYAQRTLQEGSSVPELRKWRWNAITNYDFDHGWAKGVNVGGGIRYESSVVIGYKPVPGATAGTISFDIDNPYEGPADTNFDLWVGYNHKVWRNVNWNIQLNIRNVGVGNELVPITTEPDGTPATYRIRPPQVVQLTNTFKF